MTEPAHTLQGVRHVAAWPDRSAPAGARWLVAFQSDWPDRCHQLYVDGRLAAWTDTSAERSFAVDAADAPREAVVAACLPAVRRTDAAADLGIAAMADGWRRQFHVVRRACHRPGEMLEVVDQTGRVLLRTPLWPAWQQPWSFGEDAFGLGGFGFDGRLALGLGQGAFGAGDFGLDAAVVVVDVAVTTEGAHELTLRSVACDGPPAALPPVPLLAQPPPPPAAALEFASYDPCTDAITFTIGRTGL